ncbi:MAG: hypothetical protein HYT34_01155 [Candidatus Ryanbacteria bacterium]|nr:hypothetical protein [Candidatus Ryanbacteria bacterium]
MIKNRLIKKIFLYCLVAFGVMMVYAPNEARAAVAFRSASLPVPAGSGNISLAMPTGTIENDVMIMAIVARDNVVITLPAGWTKFNELNNSTALRSTMAWKRAVLGEAGPYLVTHSGGNAIIGAISSYSGVVILGNPVDASSTRANASSLTTTANSITTSVDGALIIFTSHYGNDFSAGHGNTPYTCTDPTSFSERIDAETMLASDASLAIADATRATAGATGNCTESMTGTAAINIGALTALRPEPPPSNVVTVGTSLAQPTNVTEGNTAVVMGAFTFISSASPATITSIKVSEKGTVNANTNLSNARLYAEQEATCTFAGATQIGTNQSFTALDEATFGSLTLSVGNITQQCVFIVLDVGSSAGGGNTIEIEITASGDVAVTGASVSGTFPVQSRPLHLLPRRP